MIHGLASRQDRCPPVGPSTTTTALRWVSHSTCSCRLAMYMAPIHTHPGLCSRGGTASSALQQDIPSFAASRYGKARASAPETTAQWRRAPGAMEARASAPETIDLRRDDDRKVVAPQKGQRRAHCPIGQVMALFGTTH